MARSAFMVMKVAALDRKMKVPKPRMLRAAAPSSRIRFGWPGSTRWVRRASRKGPTSPPQTSAQTEPIQRARAMVTASPAAWVPMNTAVIRPSAIARFWVAILVELNPWISAVRPATGSICARTGSS